MLLLLVSCATDYKRPPEGGPNDKTSPGVVSSSMPDGSLNADRDTSLEIKFSEFIDRNSARTAISISPRSAAKKSKVLWYDKSVEIDFKNLDEGQTVVVSLSPSLKDTQGNPLAGSYSVSFSTGGTIDRKSIKGKITGAIDKKDIVQLNYSRIKVNLYRISEEELNLEKDEPEYSAGVSKEFDFDLKNLSSGNYKLIAFNDVNGDSKPQTETELIGYASGTIDLTEKDDLIMNLALGRNDDHPPFIKDTSLSAKDVLRIVFSEEIRRNGNAVENLFRNDQPELFEEYSAYKDNKTVYLKTGENKIGDRLKIRLKNISDDYGNTIRENFKDRTHLVTDTPATASFRLTGKIQARTDLESAITFPTSLFNNDSVFVIAKNLTDSSVTDLEKGLIRHPFMFLLDIAGSGIGIGDHELSLMYKDSTYLRSKLKITESQGYGSVSGKIKNSKSGTVAVIFKNVKDGAPDFKQAEGNSYKFDLKPGKYIIAAFEDGEKNGVLKLESAKDLEYRATFIPDTVMVRKNWETEGVDLDLKQ
jgi:hypothetical protein